MPTVLQNYVSCERLAPISVTEKGKQQTTDVKNIMALKVSECKPFLMSATIVLSKA